MNLGIKSEFNKKVLEFYDQNYDIVPTPNYNDNTRLLKPERGINRLGAKTKTQTCRFCGNSTPNVSFRKIAHVFPESIGNKTLVCHYECDECNQRFGNTIENDYANFFSVHHSLMNIRGKNGSTKFSWRSSCPLRTDECYKHCFELSYVNSQPQLRMCRELKEDFITINGNGMRLKLPIPKCNPIAVFKTIVKMAISVMPFTELSLFRKTIQWLCAESHNDIFCSGKRLLLRYKMIPGFDVIKYPHFILYRRKSTVYNQPYMLFNLTYGCFSLLIEVPRDNDNSVGNFESVPFPEIPFFTSIEGRWDLSNSNLPEDATHAIDLNFEAFKEITSDVEIVCEEGKRKVVIKDKEAN